MSRSSSFIRPERRMAIYFRDGFRCIYCLADVVNGAELTLDHLEPRGGHATENLVTCCHACNSERRADPLPEWYARLRGRGIATTAVRHRVFRAKRRPINMDLGTLAARVTKDFATLARHWPRTRRALPF